VGYDTRSTAESPARTSGVASIWIKPLGSSSSWRTCTDPAAIAAHCGDRSKALGAGAWKASLKLWRPSRCYQEQILEQLSRAPCRAFRTPGLLATTRQRAEWLAHQLLRSETLGLPCWAGPGANRLTVHPTAARGCASAPSPLACQTAGIGASSCERRAGWLPRPWGENTLPQGPSGA